MDLDTLNKEFVDASGFKACEVPEFKLMSNKKPVSPEEISRRKNEDAVYILKRLVSNYPAWTINKIYGYSWRLGSTLKWDHYMTKDENGEYNGIRWDRIHGKHRKVLKYKLKKNNEIIDKQYNTWNKYAGRKDVAYMYTYWYYLDNEVLDQSCILERICDHFDPDYYYVYAKIDK